MSYVNITDEDISRHFKKKYGEPSTTGWGPKRRFKFGHTLAGDLYECKIDKIVTPNTNWIDVGGGHALFPNNPSLSLELANRCNKLISVDPSENVLDNPYCHEYSQEMFENFKTDEIFNLATFRMVAEHIEEPDLVIQNLRSLIAPGGLVVIYTINKMSPIPIITRLTPFSWHHKIKSVIWGGEEKDTFPVAYKMNSKKDLNFLFLNHGFENVEFSYFDDTSATINNNVLNFIEIWACYILNKLGITYIENNIFAIYKKT
ncbi:class I SAM-dependent methyltransferase [Marinobacter changyiensis]|uniref:class I SAM-dependent methyltransferase n=1 Tax=Marinobacter changyiensis TaxID=2604091 RepID=UPI0012651F62|nr:methyltransferase domain-containing protein [Marinobacter changyiensis]